MDKVVHFEIPASKLDRAKKFYADTFGWQISGVPESPYLLASTTPVGEDFRPREPGAINGGILERCDPIHSPVLIINVEDIQGAMQRVASGGGKIVKEPAHVGDMGIVCYFKDPEGNVLGLWQSLKG